MGEIKIPVSLIITIYYFATLYFKEVAPFHWGWLLGFYVINFFASMLILDSTNKILDKVKK